MSGVKVFVGSLPQGTTEETLTTFFAECGAAASGVILKTEQRYAFVFFGSDEEADAAIGATNGVAWNGATLVVKKAAEKQAGKGGGGYGGGNAAVASGITPPPPPVQPYGKACGKAGGKTEASQGGDRIYVKGLPAGLTDQSLGELFQPYGQVADAKVLKNDGKSDDGTGMSIAIIRMGSEAEAQWMVDNLNGNLMEGLARPIEVSFAGGRAKGAGPYQPQQQTWGSPKGGWEKGGWEKGGWEKGGWEKGGWEKGGKGGFEKGGKGGAGGAQATVPSVLALKSQVPAGCTLYVKGLPLTADDAYLFRVFSPWGRLIDAKALQKGAFCIGFVTCLTEPEAQECIANISGVELTDGTTLQVSVKVAK